MDRRTVIGYLLLLCVIGDIGVRSSEEIHLPSLDSTSSTNLSARSGDGSSEREVEDEATATSNRVLSTYSSHENPEEPSTKPNYTKPGDWAKPKAGVPLDFVPTKLHAQVRGTRTVKRLPREEALKSAETAEEILLAPRLRQVVSKTKKNTVYTEEGYEDAAYDHAGHIRDADFHQGYARKLEDKRRQSAVNKEPKKRYKESAEAFDEYDEDYRDHAEVSSNLKSLLDDPEIDPKRVTVNEIVKLEKDLKREQEESEKNTENEVPENLRNLGNESDDGEDDESVSSEESGESSKKASTSSVADKVSLMVDYSTPDYGQLFWDYYKTDGSRMFEPNVVAASDESPKTSASPGSLATHPSNIDGVYDTLTFIPPGANSTIGVPSTVSTDSPTPSTTWSYDSWKRRGSHPSSEESSDPECATTPNVPKQKPLSYTLIIRSNDKTTSPSPDCDRECGRARQIETTPIGVPASQLGYNEYSTQFEGEALVGTEATKYRHGPKQDFTAIRAQQQDTFADFLPHPYSGIGSHVQPSLTHKSRQQLEEETNGPRDAAAAYEVSESHYDYPPRNHLGHASANLPPVRHHHRGSLHDRKNRNRRYPLITKLVPPSPMSKSRYASFLGVKRSFEPRTRFDASSLWIGGMWPTLVRSFRSVDRALFGRRRGRSVDAMILEHRGAREDVDQSEEIYQGPRRNSSARATKVKRSDEEDALNESPRIVEQQINAEIESRFGDKESRSLTVDNDPSRIKIDVPELNIYRLIDDRRKVIDARPNEPRALNPDKYPFYENSEISRDLALKYITNPRQVPSKTLGGTEFYDSRDKYLQCADVEPDLDKVVTENDQPNHEQRGDQPPRLGALGDKLDCFRAKYFDENPLDNPLFLENQVGQPRLPKDLMYPAEFASRIVHIESDTNQPDEEQIVARVSKKPEVHTHPRRGRSKPNRSATRQSDRDSRHRGGESIDKRGPRRRPVGVTSTAKPEFPITPYQREIYEDVMGTIKNLADMKQTLGQSDSSRSIDHDGFTFRDTLPPPLRPSEASSYHRYRILPYRTTRVSYGSRPRKETRLGSDATKVNYYKTVRVHKRSANDPSTMLDSDTEESRNVPMTPSALSTVASRPEVVEKTAVYTIRDRIRHSKPRNEAGRNGEFTTSANATGEDIRRREPRYNRMRSRKESHAAESAQSSKSPIGNRTQTAEATNPRQDFHDEPGELYKIQYSTPQRRRARPKARAPESDAGSTRTAEGTNRDIREDIEDDVSPTDSAIYNLRKYLQSDPPGYAEVVASGEEKNEHLEGEESAANPDEQIERPASESYAERESKPDSAESEDEQDSPGTHEPYGNSENDREENDDGSDDEENSSHGADGEKEFRRFASRPFSPFESYDDPKYSDLGPRISKPSFHHPRFTRPSSEYRSDDSGERRHSDGSDEADSGEEADTRPKSRYTAPWDQDEESDGESVQESEHSGIAIDRYEYPWEKRARLARERRRKQKKRAEYEKLFAFPDSFEADVQRDDEEQAASNSERSEFRRRVYPWERYNVPSKKTRGRKASSTVKLDDNDSMGSEHRPVRKFSSRYRSRNFDRNNDRASLAAAASSANPKQIRIGKANEPLIRTFNETEESAVTSSSPTAVPMPNVPSSRRSRKSKSPAIASTTSAAIRSASITSTEKPTTRRVVSARPTNDRPIRSRTRRIETPQTDLLNSESRNNETTINNSARRQVPNKRRRGQSVANRSSTTKITPREQTQKLTTTTDERSASPNDTTVERRSSFSKENIIKKTRYPRIEGGAGEKENSGEDNEKVLIVTKESSAEHTHRNEKHVDKDDTREMLVSAIPNESVTLKATLSSTIPIPDETEEPVKKFEISKQHDDDDDDERDTGAHSFLHDSHLVADLLRQVPPNERHSTFNETVQLPRTVFAEKEASGSVEMNDDAVEVDDDADEASNGSRPKFISDPNRRLYYYVENRKR